MAGMHVAHLNRGYLRGPFGSEVIAEFETAIDSVNGAAQRSPGYVCNVDLDSADVRAAFFPPEADLNRIAATLSVWDDPHRLMHFALKSLHGRFLARRAEWFEPMPGPAYVVWPIPAGHVPTLAEAKAAHDRLADQGAGPGAYDFKWLAAQGEAMAGKAKSEQAGN